jgi:hypothetical protein
MEIYHGEHRAHGEELDRIDMMDKIEKRFSVHPVHLVNPVEKNSLFSVRSVVPSYYLRSFVDEL